MQVNRRAFLAGGAAAAAGLTMLPQSRAVDIPPPAQEAVLKLSSQLAVIPGESLEEKLDKMQGWGFDGVEVGGDIVGNEQKYLDAIAKTDMQFNAICWGYCNGDLVSDDAQRRKRGVDKLKKALESAGKIKSTGVIYVPAFIPETNRTNQEIRQLLVETFPAIGEYAVSVGSRVLLEPLNRNEAFFLRQLADAASICRDINSPGVQMMGDDIPAADHGQQRGGHRPFRAVFGQHVDRRGGRGRHRDRPEHDRRRGGVCDQKDAHRYQHKRTERLQHHDQPDTAP